MEAALLVLFLGVVSVLLADSWLGLRDRARWSSANRPVAEGQEDRQIATLRYEIGLLLRPRDGTAGVGRDTSGRLIEAALLHGRIGEIEERRGHAAAASDAFARGVALLKAAHHPDPTEAHLRLALAGARKDPSQ